MATTLATIEYITDQLAAVPDIHVRKMFGEYALYVGKKVVALVCDDTLYVKRTVAGEELADGRYRLAPAYPGAKPTLAIDDDFLEDREQMAALILATEAELPEPKLKAKRKSQKRS